MMMITREGSSFRTLHAEFTTENEQEEKRRRRKKTFGREREETLGRHGLTGGRFPSESTTSDCSTLYSVGLLTHAQP